MLGFTGTRRGMTEQQRATLAALLRDRFGDEPTINDRLHHGNAIGADREAGLIAYILGYQNVPHRPRGTRSEDYLARNREIVDMVDELFAAPASTEEELRSGTWATIRYARKAGKLVTIVWPDGTISYEP